MKPIIFFIVLQFLLLAGAEAGELKGKIAEAKTGEAAVGAQIILDGRKELGDVAGFDGSYVIHNVAAGTYTVRITYSGFKTLSKTVTVSDAGITLFDVQLSKDDQQELKEVEIKVKRDGASENTARSIERNAAQVMNIVSGKAIQLSPDLTVANVIQRVSGISIERNSNGDGQYAILRGMDKRYNYTLVNGVKIPSPDNKYRYVPLDIFPADLLDRLEVYKALTPDMEGDAIGGAVNLVMKDAPSRKLVSVNVATGYSELFLDRDFASYDFRAVDKKSPYEIHGNKYDATPADFSSATTDYTNKSPMPNLLVGLSLGNRFFKNKLGIIAAGSYQSTFRGSNSTFFDIDKVDTFKGATLTKYDQRQYSEQQIRTGLHLKADYRFNNRNKLQWYNAYMNLNNVQIRDVYSTQLTIGGYDPVNGNATVEYSTRSRLTTQSIYNSTLQGEHLLNERLKMNWSAVYSLAKQQVPDNTTIPLTGVMQNFVSTPTYVEDASRKWEHNSDQDLAAYINFTYQSYVSRMPVQWSAGGMFRDKHRDNFYNQYQLRPTNLKALYGVDFDNYSEIDWTIQNPRGSVASALNYSATEQIGAGYLMFKATPKNMEVTGGLRAENTNQGYHMKFPLGEDKPDGNQVYLDLLPSLHFKYMPGSRTNIRASYFRSVNRPGFYEIVPGVSQPEEYKERGNPDLKHAVADNLDLRYEFYPHQGEQLMAGVFYKQIQNPIEYTLQRDAVRGQDVYYTPGNFGTARNYGLELDAIKYFRKWGIKANYTYTHSAITTTKSKRIRDEAGDLQTINVDQTRPLYGQANHIANLALLFKDAKHGWDIQLAGNYTGERIVTVSQFVDNDFWQKAFVQLDFALEKSFGRQWALFVKANNLLNTPMEVYMKAPYNNKDAIPEQNLAGQTLLRKDYYQRSYLLGVRWKL